MAGEDTNKAPEGTPDPKKAPVVPAFTTEISGSDGGSMDAGDDASFRESEAEGVSAEFNTETGEMLGEIDTGGEGDGGEGDEGKPDDGADGSLEAEGEVEAKADEPEAAADDLPALPAFDPENAEVKSQYDARYFPEGKLNRSLLSQEFAKGLAKVPAGEVAKDHGHLSEDTYKYLEEETGLSREDIHDYEAGLVARQKLQEVQGNTALVQRIQQVDGGVQAFTAAVNWAKGDKGYTAEQKARWNAIYAKGPSAELDDALDALMTRYRKANPEAPQNGNRRSRNQRRRGSTPQRSTDGAAVVPRGQAPAVAPEGFIKRADYETQFNDAYAAKAKATKAGDTKGVMDANKKLDDLARMRNQRKVL